MGIALEGGEGGELYTEGGRRVGGAKRLGEERGEGPNVLYSRVAS